VKTLKNTTLILVAIMALFSSNLLAQTFSINASSTFINAGQINFISDNGKFMNGLTQAQFADPSVFSNSGTINFAGTSCSFTDLVGDGDPNGTTAPGSSSLFRIPGYASYSNSGSTLTSVVQIVQPRWYQSLYVAATGGFSQSFTGGTYVSGTYTPSGAIGTRDYTGASATFIYDGSNSQTITGGENYRNLVFQNAGAKNILAGASVASNTFVTIASNTLTNVFGTLAVNNNGLANVASGTFIVGNVTDSGTFSIGTGVSASMSNALTNVNNGFLVAASTATYSVNGSSNTLSLDNNGNINLAASSLLYVNAGVFTNNKTDRLNMNFDVASTVIYNDDNASSTQTMVSSNWAKPYGNLATSGSATKKPDGDVYTQGSMTFTGGNINMASNTLTNLDASKNPTYAALTEVVGRYRVSNSLSAFALSTPYVLNNAATSASFTTNLPTSTYFEVNAQPNTWPTYTQNNLTSTLTDVKRRLTLAYDGSATWTMKAGYQLAETGLPVLSGGNGGWDTTYNETMLRFYEGTSASYEKMATSNSYTRVGATANSFGSVFLAGFTSTTTNVDGIGDKWFMSSNELLFRSGPALLTTIAHGRWSNPATWDEGVEPATGDQTLIRHTVWAGFPRPIDNNFATDERSGNILASNITIDDSQGNASVILGGNGSETYYINPIAQPGVASTGNMTIGTWLNTSNALTATTLNANTQNDLIGTGGNPSTEYGGFYLLNGQTLNVPNKWNVKTGGYIGTAPGSIVNVGKNP